MVRLGIKGYREQYAYDYSKTYTIMIKKIEQAMTSFKDALGNTISWPKVNVECAIDEDVIDCSELEAPIVECGPGHLSHGYSPYGDIPPENRYTGIPAPAYLKDDEWFGPAPEYTEKQKITWREKQKSNAKSLKTISKESEDIHQKMYDLATSGSSTTIQLNPPGGSENFHEKLLEDGILALVSENFK